MYIYNFLSYTILTKHEHQLFKGLNMFFII